MSSRNSWRPPSRNCMKMRSSGVSSSMLMLSGGSSGSRAPRRESRPSAGLRQPTKLRCQQMSATRPVIIIFVLQYTFLRARLVSRVRRICVQQLASRHHVAHTQFDLCHRVVPLMLQSPDKFASCLRTFHRITNTLFCFLFGTGIQMQPRSSFLGVKEVVGCLN